MFAQRHEVTITTNSSGSGVGYTSLVTGKLSQIRYVKSDYADGVDFNITAEATGETLWAEEDVNASVTKAPRQATHATDGTEALYEEEGAAVLDDIMLANDRIKIAVTNGGDTRTGTFHVIIA